MTPLDAAHDALRQFNPFIRQGCTAFDCVVRVVTRDGTSFFFYNAVARTWSNPADRGQRWLLVWTEHYDYHAFALGELKHYGAFTPVEIAELTADERAVIGPPLRPLLLGEADS